MVPISRGTAGRDDGVEHEEDARRYECSNEQILRVDDAGRGMRYVHGFRMGAHHRVGERDEDDSEGGTTTPSVLVTQISAVLSSAGRPASRSRGSTVLASVEMLRRPSRSSARAGRQSRSRERWTRCAFTKRMAASSKQDAGERQVVQQRTHQYVQWERLQQIVLEKPEQPGRKRGQKLARKYADHGACQPERGCDCD